MPYVSIYKEPAELSERDNDNVASLLFDVFDDVLEDDSGQQPQTLPEYTFSLPFGNSGGRPIYVANKNSGWHSAPSSSRDEDITRFIYHEFNEKLPEFSEYHRKGYNRKGLDLDALRQLEALLKQLSSEEMTPGLPQLKSEAEKYLHHLTSLILPPKPSAVLKDALNQANKVTATLSVTFNALSLAGRVGGKGWTAKVDEVVSKQLHTLAGEAQKRLEEESALPVSSTHYRQTKNALMGLMFSQSNEFTAENRKFARLKASQLAEERVMRSSLAAWIESTAERIQNGALDDINYASGETEAMSLARVIHAMNTALKHAAAMLRHLAADLRPVVEEIPGADEDWIDEVGGTIKKIPGKTVSKIKGIYHAGRRLDTWGRKVGGRARYTLDEQYGVRSESGKNAVKITGLLLLDELHQAERWLRLFPAAAWELGESVEQHTSVITPAAFPDREPVLSALLDDKLKEEAVRWEEKARQSEEKLTALVASATRLTPEIWVDDFWGTISAAFGQKAISQPEREGLLIFRDDMQDIVKTFSDITRDIEGSTLHLARHGHAGGEDLKKKLAEWLRELNLLKGRVSQGVIKVTGENVEYYSRRGMLARGIAQWGEELKQAYLQDTQPEDPQAAGACFDERLIKTVHYHADYFVKENSPAEKVFLERLKLEVKHAAQHTTTYPPTPEEILAGTRSLPDDIKHWAQKKVTNGVIDAVIRQGVKVFTRPLSLPGRILWRIARNGYVLYRGIEGINRGIKVGEGPATRVKERFIENLLYKSTLRLALSLSPVTALGLAGVATLVRLASEDDYLKKFVTDTLNDLPEDMLWRGAYVGACEVYHRITWGDAERKAAENTAWVKVNCPLEIKPENGPEFNIKGDPRFRFSFRQNLEELQKQEAGQKLLAQLKGQVVDIRPPHDDDFQRLAPDGTRYSGSRVVDNTIYIDPDNNVYGEGLARSAGALQNVSPSVVLFHQLKHIQSGTSHRDDINDSGADWLAESDYRQEFLERKLRDYIKDQQGDNSDNDEVYEALYPQKIKTENAPEFILKGAPEFRAAVHIHLGELHKHPSGRAILALLKNRVVEIRPPHQDDVLRTEPDGTCYYGSRVTGNTIYFDPNNYFYGKSREENSETFRRLDPSIVLFHELLHIHTGETGHRHIVPSDPALLDENDYRREYYASRGQDPVERAWNPQEDNPEVSGYASRAQTSASSQEKLGDAELEHVVQYVIKNSAAENEPSGKSDLAILKRYLDDKEVSSLSASPQNPPAMQEGDILEKNHIVTDATQPWKGRRWLYLNGRYWPLRRIDNVNMFVNCTPGMIWVRLESGPAKPIIRITKNSDYISQFFLSQVSNSDFDNDETKEIVISYARYILKKHSYANVNIFSRALQLAINLHIIKLRLFGDEENAEHFKSAESQVEARFGLSPSTFSSAEQVRLLVMTSDYKDNDKNMLLLSSILLVRTMQGHHFYPYFSTFPAMQEGDVLQGKQIVTDFSSEQTERRWIYLAGTYWPLVTLSNKKQAIEIDNNYINITRIPGPPAKWVLDTPEVYAYELYAGMLTSNIDFKYTDTLDTERQGIKGEHRAEAEAEAEAEDIPEGPSHDLYYSIPGKDDYTDRAAIDYLSSIHELDSQYYHDSADLTSAVNVAEQKYEAAIQKCKELHSEVYRLNYYATHSNDPTIVTFAQWRLKPLVGELPASVSSMFDAQYDLEMAKEAATRNILKYKNDAALRHEMQIRVKEFAANEKRLLDFDSKLRDATVKLKRIAYRINGLTAKLKEFHSSNKVLSSDEKKAFALLKYELYYTIWLRKGYCDTIAEETEGPNVRQYNDLSDSEKTACYFDAIKYMLLKIESDPSIPEISRINAHDARMGYERVTPVDVNGFCLINCFFIPDDMGAKTGVLIDMDYPARYNYVNNILDFRSSLKDRLPASATRNQIAGSNGLESFAKLFEANRYGPGSDPNNKWHFNKVFNSNEPARIDIQSMAKELSQKFDENGSVVIDTTYDFHKTLFGTSATHHVENTNVRRLAAHGDAVDDSKFKVRKILFTWAQANQASFRTKFLRGLAHPAEVSAEAIQEKISIDNGDSVELASAKIIRAKKIGAWVDTLLAFSFNFVPGGTLLSLAQAAADIAADISEGTSPDALAVASLAISVFPGSRVAKFVGTFSKTGMNVVKYSIIISGKTLEAAALGRSILLAQQTGDPLHITQACLSAGLSARDAEKASSRIYGKVIKKHGDDLPSPNNRRPTHVHKPEGSKTSGINAQDPESQSGRRVDDSGSDYSAHSRSGHQADGSDSGYSSNSLSDHHFDDSGSSGSQAAGSYANYSPEKKSIFLNNERIKARNKLERAKFFDAEKSETQRYRDELTLIEGRIRENDHRLANRPETTSSDSASATPSISTRGAFIIHNTEFIARNNNDALEVSDDSGYSWTTSDDASLSTLVRDNADSDNQRPGSDLALSKSRDSGSTERGTTFTWRGDSVQGRQWRGYFEISQDGGAHWEKGNILHKLAWQLGAEERLSTKRLVENIDTASKKNKYFSSMCYTNAFNVARQAQVISEPQLNWLNKVAKPDANKQIIGSAAYRNVFGLQGRKTFATFTEANIKESGFMHVGMRDKNGVESYDHVVYVHVNDNGTSLYQANSFDFGPALSEPDPVTKNNLGPNASQAHFRHDMDAVKINNFDNYFKKIEADGSQAIFTFTSASEVRHNYDVIESSARPVTVNISRESLLPESTKRDLSAVEQQAIAETTSTLQSNMGVEYDSYIQNLNESSSTAVKKVVEILTKNGYERVRVLELGFWPDGGKTTVATHHYVVVATRNGVEVVVDLNARQFKNQYEFSGPPIASQINWLASWQRATKGSRTLIKLTEVSGSLESSPFSESSDYIDAHKFVPEGQLINQPAWYRNTDGVSDSELTTNRHGSSKNSRQPGAFFEDAQRVATTRYQEIQSEAGRLAKQKSLAQYNYNRAYFQSESDDTLVKACQETLENINEQIDDNQQRLSIWSQRLDDLHSDISSPPYWYEKLQSRDASRSVSEVLRADENAMLDTTEIDVGHNLVRTNHVDLFPHDEDSSKDTLKKDRDLADHRVE